MGWGYSLILLPKSSCSPITFSSNCKVFRRGSTTSHRLQCEGSDSHRPKRGTEVPSILLRTGIPGGMQWSHGVKTPIHVLICFYLLFVFVFLGPHPLHVEVPRLEGGGEWQLPAYTRATATPDPQATERGQGSNVCPHGYKSGLLPLSHNRNAPRADLLTRHSCVSS